MPKKIAVVLSIMLCSLLLVPNTAQARGDYDYDAAQVRYTESAREEVTMETRPEYALLNGAIDNESIRDYDYARFTEMNERHFLTLVSEEDQRVVFGHEETFSLETGKVYTVEIYLRNDATLCLEHSPLGCEKTLQEVKVKAAYPDMLTQNQYGCVMVEITSANGEPQAVTDFVEIINSGESSVYLSLVEDSLVIESLGLTNGMQLDQKALFDDGVEVGFFSLDSGIPAGYALKVKFQIQT